MSKGKEHDGGGVGGGGGYFSRVKKWNRLSSHRSLEMMLTSESFTRRDVQLLLIGMASNEDGYEVAWDFIRQNWEEVVSM